MNEHKGDLKMNKHKSMNELADEEMKYDWKLRWLTRWESLKLKIEILLRKSKMLITIGVASVVGWEIGGKMFDDQLSYSDLDNPNAHLVAGGCPSDEVTLSLRCGACGEPLSIYFHKDGRKSLGCFKCFERPIITHSDWNKILKKLDSLM